MFRKTSKSFVLLGGLLVFSLLLASCQSTKASNEEMEGSRVIDAWGANLTAQGERYLEEVESNRAMEAWGANLSAQGERYLGEMASNRAVDSWGANLTAQGESYLREMESNRSIEAWGANLTAHGDRYLEEMESNRVVEAWGANLTAQGESYLEEMVQANVLWIELRSDVPEPVTELMVEALTPGIKIRRTWIYERTFLTTYTIMSDRPVWAVFHADQDGVAGEILQYIYVGGGINKIARTENLGEMSSKQIHIMLHEDLGRISLFEFPGSDSPVFVEDEIVNELCFCPF